MVLVLYSFGWGWKFLIVIEKGLSKKIFCYFLRLWLGGVEVFLEVFISNNYIYELKRNVVIVFLEKRRGKNILVRV